MAFNLSRAAYLADFYVTPSLIAFALGVVLWWAGPSIALCLAFVVGYFAWIVSEYVTHRFLFHGWYRREHWMHHIRPASDIGVPPTYTVVAQLVAYGVLVGALGLTIGSGMFAGYACGYLVYLITHHAFHRWAIPVGHWLRSAYERHVWHHMGHEVNFNVLIPLCDRLFGTFEQPDPAHIK